jgi:diguanylate cyclase (GGDEF)-like protein
VALAAESVLLAGILAGLAITILGALAMLSIGLSRRLRHEATEHRRARTELETANRLLHQQVEEITELQTRLKQQAIRDGLTGLFNRRYLDETLPRELARAKRDGYALALIMVDIDHFKQVNDTYGHPGGDAVIRHLGQLLLSGAREGDVVCRYGGEEFVVALPHMDLAAAMVRAEAWRCGAEAQTVAHGELAIRYTLSAGVAGFPTHAGEFDALLECADRALYRSKQGGRNRVTPFAIEANPC